MASRIGMAYRNEQAGKRIDDVVQRLAAHLDIEISPVPTVRTDAVLQETLRLEWSADVLESVAAVVEAQPPVEKPEDDQAADDLSALKREQLEAIAADLGIEDAADKHTFPNKGVLIEAIEAARADASGNVDTSSPDTGKPEDTQDPPEPGTPSDDGGDSVGGADPDADKGGEE